MTSLLLLNLQDAISHTFELGFSCWHSNFAGSAYALWFWFASIELRS